MKTEEKANANLVAVEEQPTATVAQPILVEKKYQILVNDRKGDYHPLPKKLRDEESRPSYIGSEFIAAGGSAVLRGLNNNQERFYGSTLINKSPKDTNFDEIMTHFWADFRVTVPKDGLKLDASYKITTKVIDGERVEFEEPININDYMRANFAMKNSRVAFYKEEKDNKSLYDFIMLDLSEAQRIKESVFELETLALTAYADLVKEVTEGKDNEKIHFLLDVLQNSRDNFFGLSVKDKLMKLKDIMNASPVEFYKAITDKKLSLKSRFFRLVQTRTIILEGETYFYDDIALGTKNEALAFLEDATKSPIVSKMIARLNEALK
jgi:hypothetical protein